MLYADERIRLGDMVESRDANSLETVAVCVPETTETKFNGTTMAP